MLASQAQTSATYSSGKTFLTFDRNRQTDRTSYHKRDRATQYGRLKTVTIGLTVGTESSLSNRFRGPGLRDRQILNRCRSIWCRMPNLVIERWLWCRGNRLHCSEKGPECHWQPPTSRRTRRRRRAVVLVARHARAVERNSELNHEEKVCHQQTENLPET